MFTALMLEQQGRDTLASVRPLDESQLPEGDVTVAVDYSSLNYKDGLAITGKGRIVRQFPMVPGIDFAGRVIESSNPAYRPGDKVVLTGWGVGETHWGGMAQKARVNGDWLVPLPDGLDARKAMIIGTAGLTAMLCVMGLEQAGVTPEQGEILVTGASGGVGSVAVALLAQLGYRVVALTGRSENEPFLKALGAERSLARETMLEPAKPLEKQLWAGVIDTAGDQILAKALAQTHYDGAVAACGLAAGYELHTTVMPFILRGVKLIGIDSVMAPLNRRQQAWQRLATLLPASFYDQAAQEISLDDAADYAQRITEGQITGRTLIKL